MIGKGKISLVVYCIAILLAFWWQWISLGLYVLVALIWHIPDQRIARACRQRDLTLAVWTQSGPAEVEIVDYH